MSAPAEVTVNIRGIAVGGSGVGEVSAQADGGEDLLGITAFVPFTAPGETVSARITQNKKRYVRAQLIEIEQSSDDRVEPSCPYFTTCGGCELQHIDYEAQLDAKYKLVHGSLRTAKLSPEELDCVQPVVAGEAYGYRRRITLHVDSGGRIGFYRAESRSVVPINSCDVADPAINEVLPAVLELSEVIQGRVSTIVVEADAKGVVLVLSSPYDLTNGEQKQFLDAAKDGFSGVKIISSGKVVAGSGRQHIEISLNEGGTFLIQVPAGSFSQVNSKINLRLVQDVVQQSEAKTHSTVYDLYAGAGNFSFSLARTGAHVVAVECDEQLVSLGRQNTKRRHMEQLVDYHHSSVEKFLKRHTPKKPIDAIVADPPRSGLGNLIPDLFPCERLLLISCHLPSCVRDIKNLKSAGWKLQHVQAYDMFAQTSYVEVLSVFTR